MSLIVKNTSFWNKLNPNQTIPFKLLMQFMKKMFGHHVYSLESSGTKDSVMSMKLTDAKNTIWKWASTKICIFVLLVDLIVKLGLKQLNIGPSACLIIKLNCQHKIQQHWRKFAPSMSWKRTVPCFARLQRINSLGSSSTCFRYHWIYTCRSGWPLIHRITRQGLLGLLCRTYEIGRLRHWFFGSYIGCSPDKVDKAIQMMHAEFDKLSTALISLRRTGSCSTIYPRSSWYRTSKEHLQYRQTFFITKFMD